MQSTTAVFLWKKGRLNDIAEITMGQSPDGSSYNFHGEGIGLINGPTEFTNKYPVVRQWTTKPTKLCRPGDILLCVRGSSTGRMNLSDAKYCIGRGVASISAKEGKGVTGFLYYLLDYKISQLLKKTAGTTFPNLSSDEIRNVEISIPSLEEQHKIADILSTWDKAIELKEKLIEQKKEQKKGLMQRLLTGKVRLSGFEGEWKSKKLGEITECLDNLRKPLNSSEREKMKGDIPYYGANGVVDYVNDFIFNEKLILLAEDGGYFDEFSERPIAFRIEGKSWVNNHAHVLRVREGVDFDFLFYSLVHKDIRPFINGTTRTKLTKNDMLSIEVQIPNYEVQKKIATILNSIDKEIGLLERETELIKQQKKGLMQLLLTGKVRVKC